MTSIVTGSFFELLLAVHDASTNCTDVSMRVGLRPLLLFFLLNMLWSRRVKPSPAIGEKSERSEIKDIKVCTDRSFPESVKCTIYNPLYKNG